MNVTPLRQEGYQLLHDGAIALAQVEANGIRVDLKRLESTKQFLKEKVRTLRSELEADSIWRTWRKRFGFKSNLTSRDQLAEILHVQLDYEVEDTTDSGRPSMDSEALQKFDNPFVDKLARLYKYRKVETDLKGIEREIVGDRLHPSFGLHVARTFRSNCTDPNFQNQQVRDKESAELVRGNIIASSGCVLVERDFKGIEVGVSACYHKDENFISYITTPGRDMHRDMAAQIYFLDKKQVDKDIRYAAKNNFVFPQFYGDYYLACAKHLWEVINRLKLKGPDGKSLKRHLKRNGISGLGQCDPEQDPVQGTFEHHLKEVENDFWNNRFRQYGQWKRDWYQEYLEKGYFDLLSGFRITGALKRNQVTNYPVQGSAFHCLLWTLIQLQKALCKYKMKSRIVGQIHDSMIGDVREDELKDYLEIGDHIVTKMLPKHYPWLIVPLEVECEISPPGGNWFQKQEIKFTQGRFLHPKNPAKSTADAKVFLNALENLLKHNGKTTTHMGKEGNK